MFGLVPCWKRRWIRGPAETSEAVPRPYNGLEGDLDPRRITAPWAHVAGRSRSFRVGPAKFARVRTRTAGQIA